MKQIDLHLHTDCSADGRNSAAEVVEAARARGLSCIALTDHCEVERYFSDGYPTKTKNAFAQAAAFRGNTAPEVLCGIELGQPNADFALSDRILAAHPYDFVLVSLHNLPNTPPFYYLSDAPADIDYLLNRYLDAMAAIVAWGNFDAVAHFTYPLRYIEGTFGHSVDWSRYADKLDGILAQLAQQNKALEINLAGLRSQYGKALPDSDILRRFRALGGKYVTLGSDAHSADEVGCGIAQGIALANSVGFSEISLFRKRKMTIFKQ